MKTYLLLLSILFSAELFSQCPVDNDTTKRIKVYGTAEITLQPTSYIIDIMLKETYLQPRNYSEKPLLEDPIDSLELQLKSAIASIGLDTKTLKLNSISSYPSNMGTVDANLLSANYEYKLIKVDDLNNFLKKVNFKGIAGLRVRRQFEVDKNAIKKQLNSEALKDAKQKADDILNSTNKKVGEIIVLDLSNFSNQLIFDDPNQESYYGYSGQYGLNKNKTFSVQLSATYRIVD